jgi:hypothetical protein
MKSGRRGLTLAEVVLCLGLLGLLLVATVGLFHGLLGSSTKSGDLAAATLIAQQRLDELVAQQPAYRTTYGSDFPTDVLSQTIYTRDSQSALNFSHRARPELLDDRPNYGRTYYLEVEVYWSGNSDTTRARQGLQSLKLGRVVYLPTS